MMVRKKLEKGVVAQALVWKMFYKKNLVKHFTIFKTVFFTQEKMLFWINQSFTTKQTLKSAKNIF